MPVSGETTFLTVEDLAERWHTTPPAVHQQRHRGVLPPGHRLGKRVLWRLDVIEAFEATRQEHGGNAASASPGMVDAS